MPSGYNHHNLTNTIFQLDLRKKVVLSTFLSFHGLQKPAAMCFNPNCFLFSMNSMTLPKLFIFILHASFEDPTKIVYCTNCLIKAKKELTLLSLVKICLHCYPLSKLAYTFCPVFQKKIDFFSKSHSL